jgi:hypothetical protein
MKRGMSADSAEVQMVIHRHYEWLSRFWTPNCASYAGYGQFVVESKLRHAFEEHDPKLPEFVREGIRVYAERNLS